MRQINLNRQLLGLEDILFGTGTVTQTRGGQLATVTKINAGNLPFDETRTLIQWAQSVNVEALGSMITELQAIYDNLAIISNIEDNLALLNNINSNITVLQTLHTNLSILQNVNSNIPIITDVNNNLDILTSIYNNLSSLVNIHTNLTSLLAIDSNMQQLLNLNTNLPELLSINTNIVPNITEILDVNNKAEQVALDKQAVESLASQVTSDKQDVNTMKLAVETIYDTFDDRFLGAKDADPLVDNDGNALLDGALYFNTVSNALKVYALGITTWVTIPQIYLSGLLDVQLTSITTNSILTWNGSKWINTTTPAFDSVKLTGTNYGVMSWNPDEQVPSITLNSDVDIDLGESLILVKNTTGSTILDGKVVMAIGSNGNSGNILVSLHSGLKTDAKRTIGIATQNILNDSTGFVTKEGKVKGINTTGNAYGETWVDGDILYVKANGDLTKVEPLDSQLKMPIAFVVHAHTTGTLYVRTLGIDENHDRDLISTKLDTSDYTATDILTKLKTVDGSGSGLEADTATKLSAVRTIELTGDVTGSVSFDGSTDVSITAMVSDDSHNHVISNVDGLQDALDSKAPLESPTFTGTPKIGTDNITSISTSVTDNAIARYDGTTGKLQNSGVVIDDTGNVGIGTGNPIDKLTMYSASGNLFLRSQSGTSTLLTGVYSDGTTCVNSLGNYPLVLLTNNAERMRIDTAGNVLVTSPAGIGYGTGAGGTVTQLTSKSTAVTLNKPSGTIITSNSTLAAGEVVFFSINNSLVTGVDTIIVNCNSGNYKVTAFSHQGHNIFTVGITNISGSTLSQVLYIDFTIIKGSSS